MKALVISDKTEITDYVTPLLKNKGFDIIHYRWIIKALDNIEEIQPDVIVLSANEYPRHWKTLAGFVQSGIGGNDVKVYLYDTEPLTDEDNKKAQDLGVISFEQDFSEVSEELENSSEEDVIEENVAADDDYISMDIVETKDVELAYSDLNGKFRFCNAKYNPGKDCVQFSFDCADDVENGFVKYVSMYDGNAITSFSANAKREMDSIYFYVKEYYEKTI